MDDINTVIKEWQHTAKNRKLKNRELKKEKLIKASGKRIVSLTGIRRAGKSSFLMLLYRELLSGNKKAVYINLEDDRLQFKGVLDEILKNAHYAEWFLLDEITNVEKWENWLHRMAEMKNIKLIVASSLNKLSRYPPKPLRGRVTYFEMFPLSFKEFMKFNNVEVKDTVKGIGKVERLFEEFLVYGGFPEVALSNGMKVEIIQEYFNSIVSLDISALTSIPLSTVSSFAHRLIETTFFSASKIERTMKSSGHKISKNTILDMEKLFEDSYLAFFVPISSPKVKDRKYYPRKIYMGDTGFLYSVTGKKDFGRLYENAVFLQLRRKLSPIENISYYKSKDGYEVDFVIKKGNRVKKLIQVAYKLDSEKTREREIRSLLNAADDFDMDGNDDELVLINRDKEGEERINGKKITFRKLWKWMVER